MSKKSKSKNSAEVIVEKEHKLGFFEKYLTLWVAMCIFFALALGQIYPGLTDIFEAIEIGGHSVPVAIVLFLMIYPIMIQTDLQKIIDAGKSGKPIIATLILNWGVKPFTKALIALLFFRILFAPFIDYGTASEIIAGLILLGIAPCTAMVLVWGYLSKGNMGHTVVMSGINSLSMVLLFAPLAILLLPVADVPVPFIDVALGVIMYVGLPLAAGYLTRKILLDKKGADWFEKFTGNLKYISEIALLITIIVIVAPQSGIVIANPMLVLLILIPLTVQFFFMFGLAYWVSKKIGLSYEDAAPTAQISASNHFEVAIAMAVSIFGIDSGATLAAVTGMLVEVPVMLILVQICLRTRKWFPK